MLFTQEAFSYRALPETKIAGTECVGLVLETKESFAIWLVY